MKKLQLNKQRIAKLSNEEASNIMGGGDSVNSTNRRFTCCWCTGGNTTDEPTNGTCPSGPTYPETYHGGIE